MSLSIKIHDRNPFSWLAFLAVALSIFAYFTTISIPMLTYALVGCVFLYSFSNGGLIRSINGWFFVVSVLLIVYILVVSLMSNDSAGNMTKAIIYQLMVCLAIYIYLVSNKCSNNKILFLISISVLILCGMILTDDNLFETLKSAEDAKSNAVYYTFGENNRNVIAIILGLGALCMLHLGFSHSKIWFLLMAVDVALGLFTGSRKLILTVLTGTVLYLFLQNKYVRKKTGDKKNSLIVLVLLLLIGFMLYACFAIPMLYNIIGSRIEGLFETLSGDGNGEASAAARSEMATQAIEMFWKKPILGWGIEGFATNSDFGVYSHNNYTETLVSFGLVGFVFLYFYKIKLLITHFRLIKYEKNTNQSLNYIIFFVLMFVSLILDFAAISMNSVVVNLPFAVAAAQQYNKKVKKGAN